MMRIGRMMGLLIGTVVAAPSVTSAADDLRFTCVWMDQAITEFSVSSDQGTVVRSDSPVTYEIAKISTSAVWLTIAEDRPDRLTLQVIERSKDAQKPGNWLDLQLGSNGEFSPVIGGKCVER